MSTILDAQRELERRSGSPAPLPKAQSRRSLLVAAALLFAVGGATSAFLFVPREPSRPAAIQEVPAAIPQEPQPAAIQEVPQPAAIEEEPRPAAIEPEPAPLAAEPPRIAAPAVAPRIAPAAEEPPRGRVHARKKPPDDPRQSPVQNEADPPRPRAAEAASRGSESRRRLAAAFPGGQLVSLISINCAARGEQCTAELNVDGRIAQVHEGGAWQGVEVDLILPDSVYVRQGGTVLALRAP